MQAHNKRILIDQAVNVWRASNENCNCLRNRVCPFGGNCNYENVIYKAEVLKDGENLGQVKIYVGLAGGFVKRRLSNHQQSFTNEDKRFSTAISKYVWQLKDRNQNFDIHWTILAQEKLYDRMSKKCQLCLREKVEIK